MLVDELLPTYDISDSVATVVHANSESTWDALMDVDMLEVGRSKPLIGLVTTMRMLPDVVAHILHGERSPAMPDRMRLRDLAAIPSEQGGWVLLGERPADEIALGLIGKFWRPIIEYAAVPPEAFSNFSEPGYAKHIYSLSVRGVDDARTLLRGEMRVATTDEHARRWFRRYWTFGVGSGAHLLVNGVIEQARDDAEGGGS